MFSTGTIELRPQENIGVSKKETGQGIPGRANKKGCSMGRYHVFGRTTRGLIYCTHDGVWAIYFPLNLSICKWVHIGLNVGGGGKYEVVGKMDKLSPRGLIAEFRSLNLFSREPLESFRSRRKIRRRRKRGAVVC